MDTAIQRDAFFALQENILLSMMTDEKSTVRLEALDKIIDARQHRQEVNQSKLPKVNFEATNYANMID